MSSTSLMSPPSSGGAANRSSSCSISGIWQSTRRVPSGERLSVNEEVLAVPSICPLRQSPCIQSLSVHPRRCNDSRLGVENRMKVCLKVIEDGGCKAQPTCAEGCVQLSAAQFSCSSDARLHHIDDVIGVGCGQLGLSLIQRRASYGEPGFYGSSTLPFIPPTSIAIWAFKRSSWRELVLICCSRRVGY